MQPPFCPLRRSRLQVLGELQTLAVHRCGASHKVMAFEAWTDEEGVLVVCAVYVKQTQRAAKTCGRQRLRPVSCIWSLRKVVFYLHLCVSLLRTALLSCSCHRCCFRPCHLFTVGIVGIVGIVAVIVDVFAVRIIRAFPFLYLFVRYPLGTCFCSQAASGSGLVHLAP